VLKEIVAFEDVVRHSGVVSGMLGSKKLKPLSHSGTLLINGREAELGDPLKIDDIVTVGEAEYRVISGGPSRLQLSDTPPEGRIEGKIRAHCGLHKCMTMYSRNVYRRACRSDRRLRWPRRKTPLTFRHFYHRLDAFYNQCHQHAITSVSGHALDLDRFDDIRVVRFIRDPRDLLISSYFYHKRGAEYWCHLPDPTDTDWQLVRGIVPEAIPAGASLTNYLHDASLEDGLFAEIELRRLHLKSMMEWPVEDDRVKLFRYEEILGDEIRTFEEIFNFFEMPMVSRVAAAHYAKRFRAGKKEAKPGHIRNASHGQWRELFTPALCEKFNEQYGDLLERYGYPLD
jgi:hypothetical protein